MKYVLVIFLLLFLFSQSSSVSFAKTPTTLQQISTISVTYTLPYPGILPDNPLYGFKVLRDKIVSFFITDAQKQAEFDLLQADKRLAAGQYLMQEKTVNQQLVSETISKSENYFGQAVENIAIAKSQGKLVNNFLDTLRLASIKHQQVLFSLSQTAKGALKQTLQSDSIRMAGFEKAVNKMKLAK